MGIAIPFPQQASRTYELSGSVSRTLVLGKFVFNPQNLTKVLQVRKGVLYRILAVSFSANCDETQFRQAFEPVGEFTEPLARLTLNGNYTIAPKAWPVRAFYQSRETLNYFVPSADNSDLSISFSGTFEGTKIPGLPTLTLSYSFSMQELASESWHRAYDEGKF